MIIRPVNRPGSQGMTPSFGKPSTTEIRNAFTYVGFRPDLMSGNAIAHCSTAKIPRKQSDSWSNDSNSSKSLSAGHRNSSAEQTHF
jgi:hypothetical protein